MRQRHIRTSQAGRPEVLAAFTEMMDKVGITTGNAADVLDDFCTHATQEWIPSDIFEALKKEVPLASVWRAHGVRAVDGGRKEGICAFLPAALDNDKPLREQLIKVRGFTPVPTRKRRKQRRGERPMLTRLTRHGAYAAYNGAFSTIINSTYARGGFGRGTIYRT